VLVPKGRSSRVAVRLAGYLPQARRVEGRAEPRLAPMTFTLANARGSELRTRLGGLIKELTADEARLAKLQKQQSGLVLRRTATKELAISRAVSELEQRTDELRAEISDLEDELARMEPP
jgi:uncharacterized protein involved in exopolysaccharide biosynthesis